MPITDLFVQFTPAEHYNTTTAVSIQPTAYLGSI